MAAITLRKPINRSSCLLTGNTKRRTCPTCHSLTVLSFLLPKGEDLTWVSEIPILGMRRFLIMHCIQLLPTLPSPSLRSAYYIQRTYLIRLPRTSSANACRPRAVLNTSRGLCLLLPADELLPSLFAPTVVHPFAAGLDLALKLSFFSHVCSNLFTKALYLRLPVLDVKASWMMRSFVS